MQPTRPRMSAIRAAPSGSWNQAIPTSTVPMGAVKGLPVGLSFLGPKWSDGLVLSLGYAYEQAARKLVTPGFLRSIEESREIAPLLRPAAR